MAMYYMLVTFLACSFYPNSFIECLLFLKVIFVKVLIEDKLYSWLTVFEEISPKFFSSLSLNKIMLFFNVLIIEIKVFAVRRYSSTCN